MKTPYEMKEVVMRNVYRTYFFRQLARPALRIGVFGTACLLIAGFVSVPNVIQNASQTGDILAFLRYAFVAFVGTQFIVQAAIIAGAFVVGASLKDFVASIFGTKTAIA